jgi:catechol 2,3-dioxygenase-like lactoylglutathione lyase family enzyme
VVVAGGGDSSPAFRTQGLDHVALSVANLERSERFYNKLLGLERTYEQWHEPRFMVAEGTGLALFRTEEAGGDHPGPQALHVAFRVDRQSFETAQQMLKGRDIDFSFSDHGICHSIYFKDPDGHEIELTTYDV